MKFTRRVEWEGEHTRLVHLGGLPRGRGETPRDRRRAVRYVFIHATFGARVNGIDAVSHVCGDDVASPKYAMTSSGQPETHKVFGVERPKVIGGGRNLAGPRCSFLVPTIPAVVEGKVEVYRLQTVETVTAHTGGLYDGESVGVALVGAYRSRHVIDCGDVPHAPDSAAMLALGELVLDYLIPSYGLPLDALRGSFDAGDASSPGDYVEQWIRNKRGEPVPSPDETDLYGSLTHGVRERSTHEERKAALVALGYDCGDEVGWGEGSAGALRAFEARVGLPQRGKWTEEVDRAVRAARRVSVGDRGL